jgi:hypothetical protein
MAGFSQFEIQKAIYSTLSSDTTLMNMISGVYDQVPEFTAFPYISIGESFSSDWSTKSTKGSQITITLHIFSKQGGKKQALEILERIHTLLHEGSLTLTGHILIMLRFERANVVLEEDGATYQGVIRLKALTESA